MTSYNDVKTMLKPPFPFKEKVNNVNYNSSGNINPDETIEYHGLNYIFMIMKTVYGQEVYTKNQDSTNKNKLLSKINELIDEYNNTYLGSDNNAGQWVNQDLKDVCDPNNGGFSCNPKTLLNLKTIDPLNGNLRVKNKNKEKCFRKCGPDCTDGCFFTPSIKDISPQNTKYFADIFEQCACIPCFEYITQDGDIKCFQSQIVPDILEKLLSNFKTIYAATKDSNPKTAYYIYSDDFDNEYDVKEDIRLVVNVLEEFINDCRNPLSSKVQDECQENKNTRTAADPNCNNSEKIFCKNVNTDLPTADLKNCINESYTIFDVVKDNINAFLNPTDMNYCYCQEINPITGNIVETDEKTWMSRKTCSSLNAGGENFHICSDDSYSNELIKELKKLKNKCGSQNADQLLCSSNSGSDSENYESYLFNFDYKAPTINNDLCGDDINCLTYSTGPVTKDANTASTGNPASSSPTDPASNPAGSTSTDSSTKSFVSERENIKDDSIFRFASQNYCYCLQKEDQCNTWETCYGNPNSNSGTDSNGKESCADVHTSIFGNIDGSLATVQDSEFGRSITMNTVQKELAKYNIIDRDICENRLNCLGYVCENGGADNPNGSSEPHNSNMSYIRSIFYPIIPSYTGLSLKHNIFDSIVTPLNSNDQTADLDTAPAMNLIGLGNNTVTKVISDKICQYGQSLNQYASIDARAAQVKENEMNVMSHRIWQALNPLSYAGCLGEEIKSIISAIPGVDAPNTHKCRDVANADSGFFGNMSTYISDYVDSVEDNVVASSLSTVSDTLTNNSCGTKNTSIKVDYGYLRNNLVYFFAIIIFMILIPTLGPLAFLIALIITICWHIYDQIQGNLQSLDDLSETEDKSLNIFWILLLVIIILCIIYLSKNSKVRTNIYRRSRNVVKQMKDDVSDFNLFD